ncbi:glutamate--cysteine ligase regulatory subunit-like [Bacillus rossius redtenbacheri]|uniref:glutamate--cysteine ligase regulatory subunit-like n=1 Tax=Bacillus rossius redtenbacheri TaxID=93214 RepID=UPI002FDCB47C
MLKNVPATVNKILVHTENILNLNELKIKAGQNPTDELIESLKITLDRWTPVDNGTTDTLEIRGNSGHCASIPESESRSDLKISVKVFISSLKTEALSEALEKVFAALGVSFVDSLVLAYPSRSEPDALLPALQELWRVLESNVVLQRLGSIGVSDVDTDVFISLYHWAQVKPSIVQINLATCCVVPPALQDFTKEHNVQLLTHSDPFEILPKAALNEVFGATEDDVSLFWALRFQVHVKCRGVLASKGYLLCVHRTG